jgi:hypothetical protein
MTDADQLRAALSGMALPKILAQVDRTRKELGWTNERLEAAFVELRREREAKPFRSHSIEDWLSEMLGHG